MQQFHRNNHYVPQLYLKQWSTGANVQTYRLLVPHENVPLWKEHSLRGIAFHQHLYTYQIGLSSTDEFERWLAVEFEQPAEDAIRRAVTGQKMSAEHWKALIRFAVAQDVRTPASLSAFLARQTESLGPTMNATLQETVRRLEVAAAKGTRLPQQEAVSPSLFPLDVSIERTPEGTGAIKATALIGRKLWLWSIRHILTETIERITYEGWTILRAPEGVTWPTSDNPLIKLNFHDFDRYDFGGGWAARKCDILLPLSPKHVLHNSIGAASLPKGSVVDRNLGTFIRKVIVEHAHRYVFDKNISDVPIIRPRLVSLEMFQGEQEAWKRWHREQSEGESGLAQRPSHV